MPYDCGMNLSRKGQNTLTFVKSLATDLELDGAIAICNDFTYDTHIYFNPFKPFPAVEGFRTIFTVGQHPHYAIKWRPEMAVDIEAVSGCASFIGECGLDYFKMYSPVKEQKECFSAQLELAGRLNMPLYLHCRDAWVDFQSMLTTAVSTHARGGILHVFGHSEEAKREYFGLGPNWLIGLTRRFPAHITLEDVRTRVVIETDAPFFGDDVWATARVVAKHIGATEGEVMDWSDANLARMIR
jgi:Tat protein secretion system quality control protein TatD with DNase activity